ncbi:hypothetical protein LTR66_016229, partial [Elasticomyces elasticus]
DRALQIAVIGSGITGAAAAYTIAENARANSSYEYPPEITIFEQNPIIGGRLTTARVFNQSELTIDTCAATFSALLDTCLQDLALNVGLTTRIVTPLNGGQAVWDGDKIIGIPEDDGFRDSEAWSIAKTARWYNSYGDVLQNFTADRITLEQKFLTFGGLSSPFTSLRQEVNNSDLLMDVASPPCNPFGKPSDAPDWCFRDKSEEWVNEVVEAGLRERFFGGFRQNNGLATALALSSERILRSIDGGNLRLIDRLVKLSGAELLLNTKVENITQIKLQEGYQHTLFFSMPTTGIAKRDFDTVIVASPIAFANLTYLPLIRDRPQRLPVPRIPYTYTTVIHFTTTSTLNSERFNTSSPAPGIILTSDSRNFNNRNPTDIPFLSLRLLDTNIRPINSTTGQPNPIYPAQNLYKIISYNNLTDAELLSFLDDKTNQNPSITWINREYLPQSVPQMYRTPEVEDGVQGDIEIAPSLYYAGGGGGQVVDTVEIGCRMGRNVGRLVVSERGAAPRPGNGFLSEDEEESVMLQGDEEELKRLMLEMSY